MSLFVRVRPTFRLSLRVAVAVPGRAIVVGTSELAQTHVILENLSVGGALLRSAQGLREGDLLQVTMRAGCSRCFKVAGEVIYARTKQFEAQSLYGLRFVDVTAEQRIALTSYVDELRQGDLIRRGLLHHTPGNPFKKQAAACPCGCGGKWSDR
jgi:c-di-GMP-binding flagellar brake protein YcgR